MSALTPELPFSIEQPIVWGEMDAFGHVNNVAYFRYLETCRMHFLRAIGLTHPKDQQGLGVILAETTCTFLKPLKFPDQISIYAGISRIGNTSFTLAYQIISAKEGAAAVGNSVQVMYDYDHQTKSPIPDHIRTAMHPFQAT